MRRMHDFDFTWDRSQSIRESKACSSETRGIGVWLGPLSGGMYWGAWVPGDLRRQERLLADSFHSFLYLKRPSPSNIAGSLAAERGNTVLRKVSPCSPSSQPV